MKLRLGSGSLGVMLSMVVGLLTFAPSALASTFATLGMPQPVGGGITLQSIACESADTCFAVGYSTTADGQSVTNSEVIPISDGVLGTPVALQAPQYATQGYSLELTGIVCVSGSTCYAIGNYSTGPAGPFADSGGAVVMIVNGVPSQPQIIRASTPEGPEPSTQLTLTGISCWSASGCEVAGNLTMDEVYPSSNGVAAAILNGVPQSVSYSAPNSDTGYNTFNSIECFGAGTCNILEYDDDDGTAFVVGLSGSTFGPSQANTAGGLFGIQSFACYSTTSCLILPLSEGGYDTLSNDTTLGPALTASSLINGVQASCPTTTVCWIVGDNVQKQSVVEQIVSGVSQATTLTGNVGQLYGVACTTATSCLAITPSAVIPFNEPTPSTTSTSSGSEPGSSPSSGSSAKPQATVAKPTQKDGVTKVAINCKDANCSIKMTETIKVKQGKTTRLKIVASKAVTLTAGKRTVESLKLNALGAKTLKKAKTKRLKTILTITLDDNRIGTKTLTLTAATTHKA